ncbi:hypothetical protein EC991_006559 [Linnemannia zychae]|nr:hypothetical protein EC991_006559 [Linnemannia zychae]
MENAVTCISEHLPGRNEDRQEEGLLVATVSSAIYRISILDSKLDMQELFKVKEPVAALLSVPIQSSSQSDSLVVVVGAKGTMSWSKNTQPDQERGRPVATKPKTLSFDVDVQTGFIAEIVTITV